VRTEIPNEPAISSSVRCIAQISLQRAEFLLHDILAGLIPRRFVRLRAVVRSLDYRRQRRPAVLNNVSSFLKRISLYAEQCTQATRQMLEDHMDYWLDYWRFGSVSVGGFNRI